MMTYTTRQSEMVDAICHRYYGATSGYVEQVLDANPRLAAQPIPLPIGTIIKLPELARAAEVVPVVNLWD